MPHPELSTHRALLQRRASLTPLCMNIIITRAISKLTDNGVVEIPFSAWADIRQIAAEEFDANVLPHDHTGPGAYHGREFVAEAHYLIEVLIEEELADAFRERINPLVDDVIARHTQQIALPSGK
jgi:hypothetical protein